VLDGQNAVQEVVTKPGSTEAVTYLMGPRGPEYRRSSTGALSWYVYDGLGSVIGELDSSGNLTSGRLYDVYGLPREGLGASSSAHQFVGALGHPTDAETELVYMRARYMDPELGRFVSEDPAHDGANWFVYAGNDPVNFSDYDGKSIQSVITIFILLWTILQLADSEGKLPPKVSAFLDLTAAISAMKYTQNVVSLASADPKERLKGMNLAKSFLASGVYVYATSVAMRNIEILLACEDVQVEGVNS